MVSHVFSHVFSRNGPGQRLGINFCFVFFKSANRLDAKLAIKTSVEESGGPGMGTIAICLQSDHALATSDSDVVVGTCPQDNLGQREQLLPKKIQARVFTYIVLGQCEVTNARTPIYTSSCPTTYHAISHRHVCVRSCEHA